VPYLKKKAIESRKLKAEEDKKPNEEVEPEVAQE